MLERPQWSPVSIELEQACLGAILINNDAYGLVSDLVEPGHFSEPLHQKIFEVAAALIQSGKAATPLTLKTFLPADLNVSGLSAMQYLSRLATEATSVINALDYATTIRDLADRRSIIAIGQQLGEARSGEDAVSVAAWGIGALDEIVAERSNTGAPSLSLSQAIARGVDASARAYQNDGQIIGLPYGLADLDRMTLGAQRGELIIIGGRPGMGKSSLGLGIARTMAHAGLKGLLCSLEMGDVSVTHRMLADEAYFTGSRLTYHRIRSGRIETQDFDLIVDAARRLESLSLQIEQQPSMSITQVAARARQLKRRKGLDFIIGDHLGLFRPSDRYRGNRVNEIGEATAASKALAKELDIAFIMLCQLNRGVDGRDDKRPTLADLRASGDIEQDADTVILLYRKAYYLLNKEPSIGSAEHMVWQGEMEKNYLKLDAIIAKQRNGPVGTIPLFCDIGCNAIRNIDHDQAPAGDNIDQIAAEGPKLL